MLIFIYFYFQAFREQAVDGSILLMLREEHLMGSLIKMKLGEVLKLKAALASKVGSCPVCLHCIHCHKSTTVLNNSDNNETDSNDEAISSTPKFTSTKNEEIDLKNNDLLSVNQNKMEKFSKMVAERNNGSNQQTLDNETRDNEKIDGDK